MQLLSPWAACHSSMRCLIMKVLNPVRLQALQVPSTCLSMNCAACIGVWQPGSTFWKWWMTLSMPRKSLMVLRSRSLPCLHVRSSSSSSCLSGFPPNSGWVHSSHTWWGNMQVGAGSEHRGKFSPTAGQAPWANTLFQNAGNRRCVGAEPPWANVFAGNRKHVLRGSFG